MVTKVKGSLYFFVIIKRLTNITISSACLANEQPKTEYTKKYRDDFLFNFL